ncbi:MAG: pyridoxamine 5'-phosphate oxidase [Hyphomicrobiaceae bacterium]
MSVLTSEPAADALPGADDFLNVTDPFGLFEAWFSDAETHELNDPNAMALATVDKDGMPNVRVVLLKGLDGADFGPERGFVLYTNHQSQKADEIYGTGKAALNFHWKSLRRQVRIRGLVKRVEDAEADAYFASRPRGSQIGAWASRQSQPMPSPTTLADEVARLSNEFEGRDVPRPAHWSGFRLTPLSIEFWHDRPYRLHDRLHFAREKLSEPWLRAQLFP